MAALSDERKFTIPTTIWLTLRCHKQRGARHQRDQIPRIRLEPCQEGITPQCWELEVLARGAKVCQAITASISRQSEWDCISIKKSRWL